MSWIRLDDGFAQHPKLIAVGPEGLALQVRAFCYAGRYLTDGLIPFDVIEGITYGLRHPDGSSWSEVMVTAGLWERRKTGFYIHDYLTYNPSRKQVLEGRQKRSEGGKKGAESRWHTGIDMAQPITHVTATAITERMRQPIHNVNAPLPHPRKIKKTLNPDPDNPRPQVLASPSSDREVDGKGFTNLSDSIKRLMPPTIAQEIESDLLIQPEQG